MRRSVIVPLALRDAVRAVTGDRLKSGAYEYVLEGACYCRRAFGEGMWVAASSDRLKKGDLWLPMSERPGEDMHPGSPAWATVREYDPSLTPEDYGEVNPYTGIGQVRRYIPPPSRNGSLVFIEDPGGTRIRCLDHDDADDRTWIITSPPPRRRRRRLRGLPARGLPRTLRGTCGGWVRAWHAGGGGGVPARAPGGRRDVGQGRRAGGEGARDQGDDVAPRRPVRRRQASRRGQQVDLGSA
jgi:hypothetical protein